MINVTSSSCQDCISTERHADILCSRNLKHLKDARIRYEDGGIEATCIRQMDRPCSVECQRHIMLTRLTIMLLAS
ncbi:hypothetical protein SKAU_G00170750 [Synaphobranchus kaupii]|uniref:Uncharacterized protein n=1 Tax=Synaphobranchus kaupii TaxID=118154 RepID=A0A9Q1FKC3_SYNKA|nr:hypothetical protein SKAU_G00170750 [Synaphobranchus kaupii]